MSETNYIIRQATPQDFSAINTICLEAFQEYEATIGSANWQQMRDGLTHASDLSTVGELLVAEDITGLLGVVVYIPPGKSDGISIPVEWASIRMLCVTGQSRGRGIGRKLTEECIERARRDEAKAIGLTTGEIMKVAQPMYERMGFKKKGELEERYGVKQGLYAKELNEAV